MQGVQHNAEAIARAAFRRLRAGEGVETVVEQLRRYLTRKHQLRLLPSVLRRLLSLARTTMVRSRLEVSVAKKEAFTLEDPKVQNVLNQWGVPSSAPVEVKEDATLVGGWKLVWQDRMVDASTRRSLLALYQALRTAARTGQEKQ